MSRKGNASVRPKRDPGQVTPAQFLRQLAVIVVVLAIWSVLLAAYLGLTRPGESPTAASPQPTEAAATTASQGPTAAPTATAAGVTGVSFSGDVLPILRARCERCHGGQLANAGLALSSYADVMTGSGRGPVVVPGSAASSRLVEVIVSGQMPRGAARLPDAEIQTISDWIDAGALDN